MKYIYVGQVLKQDILSICKECNKINNITQDIQEAHKIY